jgi:hypothetical protein
MQSAYSSAQDRDLSARTFAHFCFFCLWGPYTSARSAHLVKAQTGRRVLPRTVIHATEDYLSDAQSDVMLLGNSQVSPGYADDQANSSAACAAAHTQLDRPYSDWHTLQRVHLAQTHQLQPSHGQAAPPPLTWSTGQRHSESGGALY